MVKRKDPQIDKIMIKLTPKMGNRLRLYILIIKRLYREGGDIPMFIILPEDIDTLQNILNNNEYNPEIYSDLLNKIEKWLNQ